jgi:hypothetical protein
VSFSLIFFSFFFLNNLEEIEVDFFLLMLYLLANRQKMWKAKFFKSLDKWSIAYVLCREGGKWYVNMMIMFVSSLSCFRCAFYTSFISTFVMASVCILGWFFMEPAEFGVAVVFFFFLIFFV